MKNHVLGIATRAIVIMGIVISVLLFFAGIGVLVLIHVCIVGMSFRRGFSERNTDVVERGSFGSTSMSQDDIEKLPCFDFKTKERGSSPASICTVCLENFKVGEKCRLLPLCNHSFHADCVDLWLLRTPICPICRTCADSVKIESILGEESNHFSETGSGRIDVRVNQIMEMIHLSGNDAEERQATETGSSSDTIIYRRESQETETPTSNSTETVIDYSERQETETALSNSSERVIDLSEHQETETNNSSEIVIHLRERDS